MMGVRKKTSSHTGINPDRGISESGGSARQKQGLSDAAGNVSPQQRIWSIVAMIPAGKVASYGQIAALAGIPRHARLVGRTLRELPAGSKLPWHRVVNAALRIASRAPGQMKQQRKLLEAEGIEFIGDRVVRAHRWQARAD